jgi:hypothetical protein
LGGCKCKIANDTCQQIAQIFQFLMELAHAAL